MSEGRTVRLLDKLEQHLQFTHLLLWRGSSALKQSCRCTSQSSFFNHSNKFWVMTKRMKKEVSGSLKESNSGLSSLLVWFVCVDVSTVIALGHRPKQLHQDLLLQTVSVWLLRWFLYGINVTSIWINYPVYISKLSWKASCSNKRFAFWEVAVKSTNILPVL